MLRKTIIILMLFIISTSVSLAENDKGQIIKNSTDICIERIIPNAKPDDIITKEQIKDINTCVSNQG